MIVAIVGPTGVGKTKLSIELAKKYNAIIVSCDAVQIYDGLNIGSAKVRAEEKENIKHYLIDIRKPNEEYTAKNYQDDLRKIINDNKDRNIIIVGGTGLYLSAGLYDYKFDGKCDAKLLYPVIFIGLTQERKLIYEKINNRVDKMIAEGLVDEVKNLYQQYPDSKVLKRAIGYKEIIEYLDGNISLEKAIDAIKQNSRHYAKRQYTWFNHKNNVKWFNVCYENFENTITSVIKYIEGEVHEKIE